MRAEELAVALSGTALDQALAPLADKTGRAGQEIAREEAPSGSRSAQVGGAGDDSGDIDGVRGSISFRTFDNPLGASIYTNDPIALLVETGTTAHEIVATKGVLVFRGSDGETVFRKRVHHPGTAPDPFIERTLARLEPVVGVFATEAGERFFASVGK